MALYSEPLAKLSFLERAACFVSFAMLGLFLSLSPIPPLVDFNGHVALAMTSRATSNGFYEYVFSPTYRLIDTFGRFWNSIFTDDFKHVSQLTYVCVLLTLLAPICLAAKWARVPAFAALAIAIGPAFLMLHSLQFVWGILPFALAMTLSATSGLILFHIDSKLASTDKSPRFAWKHPFVWLVLFSWLAIFSHPAAFVYLPFAWSCTGLNWFVHPGNWRKRLQVAAGLALPFLLLAKISSRLVGGSGENLLDFSAFNPAENWAALLDGTYYRISALTDGEASVGVFAAKFFRVTLVTIPFLILGFALLTQRKRVNQFRSFLIYHGTLSALIICLAPARWWKLSMFPQRHWLYGIAISILALVYFLGLLPPKTRRFLTVIAPILTALCLAPLKTIYTAFNKSPLNEIAATHAIKLKSLVDSKRASIVDLHGPVIVEYHPTQFGSWFHHRIVPFLMMNSPLLVSAGIIVRYEWEAQDRHLPIHLNGALLEKTQIWIWYPGPNGAVGDLVRHP